MSDLPEIDEVRLAAPRASHDDGQVLADIINAEFHRRYAPEELDVEIDIEEVTQ